MGGVWKAEEGRRKKGRFYLKKSLTKMGAKCISFFFCLLSLKWGAFGRPKKADEKKEGFAFPSRAADRHPPFFCLGSEASR